MTNELNLKNVEDKNISFFDKNSKYKKNIYSIDTNKNIYFEISIILNGTKKLLDIGHGGTFAYNTKKINKIVGLDLGYMNYTKLPKNIKLIKGSVLKIPNYFNSFDKVLMNMLLHHLTGSNVSQNFYYLNKSIEQCKKKLNPRRHVLSVRWNVYFMPKIVLFLR